MQLGLVDREAIRRISPALENELDNILAAISTTFEVEHYPDGHHKTIRVDGIRTATLTERNSQNVTPSVTNVDTVNAITLPATISTSNGANVVGPGSATDGNVALFDGTTGKLIKDGGTFGSLYSALSGYVQLTTLTLTGAQIDALNATPIQIVGAPTTGVLIPVCMAAFTKIPASVTWSGGGNYQLVWDGDTTNLLSGTVPANLNGSGVRNTYAFGAPSTLGRLVSAFDAYQKGLKVRLDVDVTPSGASYNSATTYAWIQLLYFSAALSS